MDMRTYVFAVESMIRGYHEYKVAWDNLVHRENLVCEREVGNHHATHAVAIKKVIDGNLTVVGHIKGYLLAICSK